MSSDSALGVLETRGLTAAIAGTDAMVKAADIEVIRLEKTGSNYITVLIRGDVASIKAAVDAGAEAAARHGELMSVHVIASPHVGTAATLDVAAGFVRTGDGMTTDKAIGMLETRGLTAAIAGTDAMVKAANVEVIRMERPGSNYITVLIRGDVASVKAAIDAGGEAAGRHGELVSTHVIASPHPRTAAMLDLK